jgi:hypothetical protein
MTPKPSMADNDAATTFGIGGLIGIAVTLGGLAYAYKKGWI